MEDDEEDFELFDADGIDTKPQKFGACEDSEDCYVCTERVFLNLEQHQLEITSTIAQDEVITICEDCLCSMMENDSDDEKNESLDEILSWQNLCPRWATLPDSKN